jgi:hypothetical protein
MRANGAAVALFRAVRQFSWFTPSPARRQREGGFALLLTIWVLILVALMAASLASQIRSEARIAHNRTELAFAKGLADAGVAFGLNGLLDPIIINRWPADGRARFVSYGGGTIDIHVQDEAGKLDLNTAPIELISGLLHVLAIDDADSVSIINGVLDRRRKYAAGLAQAKLAATKDETPLAASARLPFAMVSEIQLGRALRCGAVAVTMLLGVVCCLGLAARSAAAQTQSPCPATSTIQPLPIMPSIFLSSGAQIGADCLAWQEFIYLNWQANPTQRGYPDPSAQPTTFGTPGDVSPKVWESYDEAGAVFALPGSVAAKAGAPGLKPLFHLSELEDIELRSIGQAGNGKWITTQSGGLAYYEVRLDLDEVAFIKGNVFNGSDLTTFAGQAAGAVATQPSGVGGFNLPQGGGADTDCAGNPTSYGAKLGAIELKAAWVVLPADHSLDYRYLTAQAQITDPYGNESNATVGLVGLHIIHKVQGAAQFLWATFEQIDNDPDYNNGKPQAPVLPSNPNQKPGPGDTFFNPGCSPSSDPYYHYGPNTLPGPACTTPPPNQQPVGCFPYSCRPRSRAFARWTQRPTPRPAMRGR